MPEDALSAQVCPHLKTPMTREEFIAYALKQRQGLLLQLTNLEDVLIKLDGLRPENRVSRVKEPR